jgi:hypothetical protein
MKLVAFLFLAGFILIAQHFACSKMGSSFPPPPPDPCTLVAVSIGGSVTNPSASGISDGTITAAATGGNGFIYRLNGGGTQNTGRFTGLAAGNYTVVVSNSDGCSASIDFVLINPIPQCNGVNIAGSLTTTVNIPCESNTASITVNASGGVSPYYYSLDGGTFQAAQLFTNVSTGGHVVTIKDANGCTGSASTTIINQAIGPLFANVKSIIQYYCVSCHNGTVNSAGVDYSTNCNIATGKDRIKARAVDATPSPMPQSGLIPSYERLKIINWINAGGRVTD